jgi:hypothetical protein
MSVLDCKIALLALLLFPIFVAMAVILWIAAKDYIETTTELRRGKKRL